MGKRTRTNRAAVQQRPLSPDEQYRIDRLNSITTAWGRLGQALAEPGYADRLRLRQGVRAAVHMMGITDEQRYRLLHHASRARKK